MLWGKGKMQVCEMLVQLGFSEYTAKENRLAVFIMVTYNYKGNEL